jgi:predicted ATP-grasp superfamily ATP-dependent carboligase
MNELKIHTEKELKGSCMIVGWHEDAAGLGAKVIDYLSLKLGGDMFAEIEPFNFFSLGGVSVQDDIIQFPESKFFLSRQKDLVLFKSNAPRSEWYRFLNIVLDVGEHYCHVQEVYVIGGMVSLSAHTAPRELLAIYNLPRMRKVLSQYGLDKGIDYETQPGQRPTLSSFLLWVARNRDIAAASLWVPIPFYFLPYEDPASCKKVIEFFDKRFSLGIDFKDLDEAIKKQNEKIARIRFNFPEVDTYIRNLESNISLSQEESEKLVKDIEEFLKRTD